MASFLPAFQAGAAVASNRLAREQRDAEFRAQAAMRQLAERQLAQRIELEKQNADQAIQMRADAEKAAAAMTLDLTQSDIIAMPQGDQGPPQANPNKLSTSQAYLKNFGPFYAKHRPQDLPELLSSAARLEESDPNSPASQIRQRSIAIREQEAELEAQRLGISRQHAGMRETQLVQGAVKAEASLAGEGLRPTVPLMPQGVAGPQGVAAGQPLVQEAPRRLSQANVTAQQSSLNSSSLALQKIAKIRPLINKDTVGPYAAVARIVIDRGLANLYPKLASKSRASLEELTTDLSASVTEALKSDGNIAEPERNRLVSLVPTGQEIIQSPANALNLLEELSNGIVSRAVKAAKDLKQPLTDLIPLMPVEALAAAVKDGTITRAEAEAETERRTQP